MKINVIISRGHEISEKTLLDFVLMVLPYAWIAFESNIDESENSSILTMHYIIHHRASKMLLDRCWTPTDRATTVKLAINW